MDELLAADTGGGSVQTGVQLAGAHLALAALGVEAVGR